MKKIEIYSDESGTHGSERFQAIGAFSGSPDDLQVLDEELSSVLANGGLSNVSYKKITNTRDKIGVQRAIIKKALAHIASTKARIDVLIWDTQDSRHDVQGRDDTENLKRMYYHLIAHNINYWDVERIIFRPDQKTAIDWDEDIQKYITSNKSIIDSQYYNEDMWGVVQSGRVLFTTNSGEVDDDNEPLVQTADLISGLVRNSYLEHGDEELSEGEQFQEWCNMADGKQKGFGFSDSPSFSNNQVPRFKLMKCLRETASEHNFGLEFSENTRFRTMAYNRNKSLNVWKFEHQEGHDQAPAN